MSQRSFARGRPARASAAPACRSTRGARAARSLAVAALTIAALTVGTSCSPRGGDAADDHARALDQWHAERLERLRSEDGWLTLIGLFALQPGAYTLGAADGQVDLPLEAAVPPLVGTLTVAGDSVRFAAAPDVAVRVTPEQATGSAAEPSILLASDRDGQPTVVAVGSVRFQVIERGEARFLRVNDSESVVRRDFTGIERFPADASWRVTARLQTGDAPRTVPIPDVLGRSEDQPSPGLLVFEREGMTHRLIPIGEPGEPLFIIFNDRTTGQSTYGGGRYLYADPPGPDGTVVLDFNRAYNPPCAFTPYATCPLPPAENTVHAAVTAGEKAWAGRH